MRRVESRRDEMSRDEMRRDETRRDETRRDEMRRDGIGWDEMGWDEMRLDERDEMGWDASQMGSEEMRSTTGGSASEPRHTRACGFHLSTSFISLSQMIQSLRPLIFLPIAHNKAACTPGEALAARARRDDPSTPGPPCPAYPRAHCCCGVLC